MDANALNLTDYYSGRDKPERLLMTAELPGDLADDAAFRHGVQRGYLLALAHVRVLARGGTPLGELEEYALQRLPGWIDSGGADDLPLWGDIGG